MESTDVLRAAENYLAQADLDRAAEAYKQAYGLDPTNPAPAIGMARVAIILGRATEAAFILDQALAKHPSDVSALTFRGTVEELGGRLELALSWHEKATTADAGHAVSHFNRGRVLGQLQRWADAKVALARAVELDPTQYDFCYALGTAAFHAGDLDGATHAFGACLQLDPAHLDGYVTLADVLVEAGSAQLADQLLANALLRFPKAGVVHSKRVAIAMRQGDFEAARRFAAKHAELDPASESAWLTAAMLHSTVADFDAADRASRRAIELNPRSWRGHFQLGAVCEARGQRAKAKDAYRTAISAGPGEWKPLNNLANLLMEEGAHSEARALLLQALSLGEAADTRCCHYNLALACWNLGDKQTSRQAAEEAVKLGPPGHATVETARRFLDNFL